MSTKTKPLTQPLVRIPPVAPPLPPAVQWSRGLPMTEALVWLRAGGQDFLKAPALSIWYGLLVFGLSWAAIGALFATGEADLLFPALSGFMIVGPVLALGLYEKSRRLETGDRPTFAGMLMTHPKAGAQFILAGVVLALLMLLWMRSAALLFALFFGLLPAPGFAQIPGLLLASSSGWILLAVGTLVGGIFAAFGFAISVFSLPILLERRTDVLTAMGTSMALVSHNLPVMLVWGALVLGLTLLAIGTGLLGLIVIFPLLGHGSWHVYRAVAAGPVSANAGSSNF